MTENERVKALRKKLGLTLEAFGERVGLNKSSLSMVERGINAVSNQTRRSICREFNVSESWLRTGEGDMFVRRADAEELAATVNRLLTGESAEFKRRLVNALSTLKDEQWLLLEQKLKEIVGARDAVSAFAPASVDTRPRSERPIEEWTEEEINADAEEYRQQLLKQKKAKGGLSASSGAAGSAKMA